MSDYKYKKCIDCVHAHQDKDGEHDCGFMDCTSEEDKEFPDDVAFESYMSCYECYQRMVEAERNNECCMKQIDSLKETLKKVRVALIQDRVANLCNGVNIGEWLDGIIRL